jgi:hypothetical protein
VSDEIWRSTFLQAASWLALRRTLLLSRVDTVKWRNDRYVLNGKVFARKRSSLIRVVFRQFLGVTEENHKLLSQDSQCSSRDLKRRTPDYSDFILICWTGLDWVHFVCRPLVGLLYQPRMISMKRSVEWELAEETEVLGENLSRVSLFTTYPTWINQWLNRSHHGGQLATDRLWHLPLHQSVQLKSVVKWLKNNAHKQ